MIVIVVGGVVEEVLDGEVLAGVGGWGDGVVKVAGCEFEGGAGEVVEVGDY